MVIKKDKNADRVKRHLRVRKKVSGTAEKPRLNVYRSLNNIYLQIIDDVAGHTLCSASSLDKEIVASIKGMSKSEVSNFVAQELAKRAIAKGISEVVFDRGGYIYTGRVKNVADGARAAGLKF